MTEDLITWLRAQLEEDERVAKKAASLCGCHPPAPNWLFGDESTGGRIVIADDPHPDTPWKLSRRWNRSYDGLFAAEHIVRHDPARVLREVEAHRRIIAAHRLVVRQASEHPFDPFTGEPRSPEFDVTCAACGWATSDPTSGCETLRSLASIYFDPRGGRWPST